jgi:hypothetical protein
VTNAAVISVIDPMSRPLASNGIRAGAAIQRMGKTKIRRMRGRCPALGAGLADKGNSRVTSISRRTAARETV